uniref:CLIP domain-containing serine protease n=2 Tax=Biston betularia TaxID=82595 RepID=D5LPT4_BISBE|nr:prophenoloxidase activating proteinase 1 [Biston betularia]
MKMRKQVLLFVSVFWSCVYSQSCVTPLGNPSECVALYDCPNLLNAFEQSPLPSRIINFLRQSQCGFEGYTPKVCCGPLPQTNNNNEQPTTQASQLIHNNIDPSQMDPVHDDDSRPAPRNMCGIDTNGDRIYGGQITDLDEFPWMCLMGYRTRTNTMTYQCGGVLVNKRYVLTAAHCITGQIETKVGTLTTVRLGEYDIQSPVDCIDNNCADPPQEIPVQVAVPHPGYKDKNRNRNDDIGLVMLSRRANYNYYVQPICLVSSNDGVEVGSDVYVAGWGKTLNGKNSPVKLKLGMPIFDHNECVNKYQTLSATITNKQLCAGGVFSKDSCTGDSGGPLMRKRPEGIWETVAVVSFGHGCGRDGWPGVYTSVASYLDWIQNTMRSTNV